MQRIKIMAPVRDIEMADLQCSAGANELYLGLDGQHIDPDYVDFSFNGRWNRMANIKCQVESADKIGEIIDYAHSRNVEINYAANVHYLSSELSEEFDRYVDIGIDAGADSLIVSNIGLIRHIRKRGITLPIVAGVFLFTPNIWQARLLEDLGVQRVVLPQGISLNEIESFRENSDLEIEIFAHFGGGNNCGRCMLLHSPTIEEIGPGCRAAYDVYQGTEKIAEKSYFFDAAADCSLCSLPELMNAGVHVIKIVGRESKNKQVNAKITEFYSKFQDYCLEGKSVKEIKALFLEEEKVWAEIWLPRFCGRKRCRFHETKITDSYII